MPPFANCNALGAFHRIDTVFGNIVSILRPNFTSKLVHGLAFGTPKFYVAS